MFPTVRVKVKQFGSPRSKIDRSIRTKREWKKERKRECVWHTFISLHTRMRGWKCLSVCLFVHLSIWLFVCFSVSSQNKWKQNKMKQNKTKTKQKQNKTICLFLVCFPVSVFVSFRPRVSLSFSRLTDWQTYFKFWKIARDFNISLIKTKRKPKIFLFLF